MVIDVPTNCSTVVTSWTAPTVYVLNAAAITKPHATQHLASDLLAYSVDNAIISESHLKKKHASQHVAIDGYQLFRRGQLVRRGGGVAVYVTISKLSEVWLPQFDNSAFELMWVILQSGCREVIVGAFYHPPKPSYQPDQLLDYIERCTDALMIKSLLALVILAGDSNSLVSDDITSITGMLSIVKQPTCAASCLDKIFVNELCYDGVKVVVSTVKSDHKAIVVFSGLKPTSVTKKKACYRYRKPTPANHAAFLEHLSNVAIEVDTLYTLLDQFYPERVITVTSTDPHLLHLPSRLCFGERIAL